MVHMELKVKAEFTTDAGGTVCKVVIATADGQTVTRSWAANTPEEALSWAVGHALDRIKVVGMEHPS